MHTKLCFALGVLLALASSPSAIGQAEAPAAPSPGASEEIADEFPRPDARAVAQRALCLAALISRAEFEDDHDKLPDAEKPAALARATAITDWLARENLTSSLSPVEKELLDRAPGSWEPGDVLDALWRLEALGALLWSLGKEKELVAFDTAHDRKKLLDSVGFLAPTKDFVASATLRPAETIEKTREGSELWHWRARVIEAERRGLVPPEGKTFAGIIQAAAEVAVKEGWAKETLGGDFPAMGKPYRDLPGSELGFLESLAYQRHFALNWLCGMSEAWDDTPTDT